MESDKFDVLFDVLKVMDSEKESGKEVRQGIVQVLKKFDKSFTEEQKNQVLGELEHLHQRKKNSEEIKKIRERLEEERYKDMLESFIESDTSW